MIERTHFIVKVGNKYFQKYEPIIEIVREIVETRIKGNIWKRDENYKEKKIIKGKKILLTDDVESAHCFKNKKGAKNCCNEIEKLYKGIHVELINRRKH